MPLDCPIPHPYGYPSGARQYLWIASFNKVTLADGPPIVLGLQPEEYIYSPEDPLGYDRFTVSDHEQLMSYGAGGSPVVDGAWFESKYQFRWNLRLSPARAAALTAIYNTQQARLKALRTNYAVKLYDARLILQEVTPRIRAAITGNEGNYPAPPMGNVYSYPVFDILLRRPDDSGELLGRDFQGNFSGMIEALELDRVPVEDDVAFDSDRPDEVGIPLWDNTDW